jgi:hypothetical protein
MLHVYTTYVTHNNRRVSAPAPRDRAPDTVRGRVACLARTHSINTGSAVYVGSASAMDIGTRVSRQLFVKTSYLFRF